MIRFSANLGFLFGDRSLPDAIRAAKAAGFHAVECHWPFDTPASDVRRALDETGLEMLGLNTRRGDVALGENGLSALPGRVGEARAAIDEAIGYAVEIGARGIHVMAGFDQSIAGGHTFIDNLDYACDRGGKHGLTMLIEPLNEHDAPGYYLRTTQQATDIINDVGAANLKLMFDCYHVGRTEGDVITRLRNLLPIIGHIQFASVPDRGTPDHGEIDYQAVFSEIEDLGWAKPLGAEYRPKTKTEDTLGWLTSI
ncbi:MAG: TIM barrel protein [Roseibium sp.]|uniref:hydroxypyruvate isomerase family protein n=1 Tax=Roseibium sp. TaxID=1936156 RepID=UPI003D9C1396